MKYHITMKSANQKTGPIPVTTSSGETCPTACPFLENGCYASSGPMALHWKAVTDGTRGGTLDELCETIKGLPKGQLWRHNQAGDLPGVGDEIDVEGLGKLVKANEGRRGFTYTHKPMTALNMAVIEAANRMGFTINLSANNLAHADYLAGLGIAPVVAVVPEDHPRASLTPAGRKVVVCPAQFSHTTCNDCRLCASERNGLIIAFQAHGATRRRMVHIIREGT